MSRVDWEAVEREYRAGQLSIREIGRRQEVNAAAIVRRAKRDGWERDLSEKVRAKIRASMVNGLVNNNNGNVDESEAVDTAAARGVEVLTLQRGDIQRLRELELKLLQELGAAPLKTWIGQHQGEIIEKDYQIPVTERASALQALAGVQHKRIQLERQAFNLNDDKKPTTPLDELPSEVLHALQQALDVG